MPQPLLNYGTRKGLSYKLNVGAWGAPPEGSWKQRLRLRDQCIQVTLEHLEVLLFTKMQDWHNGAAKAQVQAQLLVHHQTQDRGV